MLKSYVVTDGHFRLGNPCRANLQDTTILYQAIQNGTLPAISYVKPDGWLDGHPASSKLNLFEGFVKKIVDGVQANEDLWASTAIIVTFDEGGGYYDSGYIQPLDYFGDGTRIPTLVVSPHTKPGISRTPTPTTLRSSNSLRPTGNCHQ